MPEEPPAPTHAYDTRPRRQAVAKVMVGSFFGDDTVLRWFERGPRPDSTTSISPGATTTVPSARTPRIW